MSEAGIMARIVRIHEYGDPSVLKIEDIEVPPPARGEVQIEVKSIGLNRAEVLTLSRKTIITAEAAERYGISDLDGYEPKSLRGIYGGPHPAFDLQ